MNAETLSIKNMGVVDRTAKSVHELLNIDNTKAIDSYYLAKKTGALSFNNEKEIGKIYSNNYKYPNTNRFILAKLVAEHIVSSSMPNIDLEKQDVQKVTYALAVSLLLPKDQVLAIYNYLETKGLSLESIADVIGVRYGVDSSVAKERLECLIKEEKLENVSKKKKRP